MNSPKIKLLSVESGAIKRALAKRKHRVEAEIFEAERAGLKVNRINPRFSSVAGFVKYAHHTHPSADLGAAQAIGRQSLQPIKRQYQKKTDLSHVTRFTLEKARIPSLFRTQPVNPKNEALLRRKIRKSETVSTWSGM